MNRTRFRSAMPRPLLAASRMLRREATAAERLLWGELRSRRLRGAKFRRQAVIGRFVVDFCCYEHRLVIELDGGVHRDPDVKAHDGERQTMLEAQGYHVIRFHNDQVEKHLPDVSGAIAQLLRDE